MRLREEQGDTLAQQEAVLLSRDADLAASNLQASMLQGQLAELSERRAATQAAHEQQMFCIRTDVARLLAEQAAADGNKQELNDLAQSLSAAADQVQVQEQSLAERKTVLDEKESALNGMLARQEASLVQEPAGLKLRAQPGDKLSALPVRRRGPSTGTPLAGSKQGGQRQSSTRGSGIFDLSAFGDDAGGVREQLLKEADVLRQMSRLDSPSLSRNLPPTAQRSRHLPLSVGSESSANRARTSAPSAQKKAAPRADITSPLVGGGGATELDDESFTSFFHVEPNWSPVPTAGLAGFFDRSADAKATTLEHSLIAEAAARHDAETEASALRDELRRVRSGHGGSSHHRRRSGVSTSSTSHSSRKPDVRSRLKDTQPRGAMTTGRRHKGMSRMDLANKEKAEKAASHLAAAKKEYSETLTGGQSSAANALSSAKAELQKMRLRYQQQPGGRVPFGAQKS